MVQLATRVDDSAANTFRSLTKQLGTTPSDAMRMFIMAFNAHNGFPYEVRLAPSPEPFENESDALDFVDSMAQEMIGDAW